MSNSEKSHLQIGNFPRALTGICLKERDYEFTEEEPIKGKSIVVNAVGFPFLYMADDHRKENPEQIIVKHINSYEMCFLDYGSKRTIRLKS